MTLISPLTSLPFPHQPLQCPTTGITSYRMLPIDDIPRAPSVPSKPVTSEKKVSPPLPCQNAKVGSLQYQKNVFSRRGESSIVFCAWRFTKPDNRVGLLGCIKLGTPVTTTLPVGL